MVSESQFPRSFDPRLPPAWIIDDLRRRQEERQRREEEERRLPLPLEEMPERGNPDSERG